MKIMNKKHITVTLVAVVALISGINVFNAQKSESLSDIALANVEALADVENDFNCWWDSINYQICYNGGDWLGCPCGSHKW